MAAGDIIPCYICKKPFTKYNRRSKFCSDRCRRTRASSVYRDAVNCPHCGLSFIPYSDQVKYCSPFCREQAKAEKLKRAMPLKKCGICDNMFKPVNGSHAYCSFPCKAQAIAAVKAKSRSTDLSKAKVRAYNESYVRFPTKRTQKNWNLVNAYGMTIEEYEQRTENQGGLCAVCEKEPPGRRPLFVDHCHATTNNRDLLCINCNNIIGNADDSIKRLYAAIDYLVRHKTPQKE